MSGEVNVGAIAGSIVLTDETERAVTSASNRITGLTKKYSEIEQAATLAGKGASVFASQTVSGIAATKAAEDANARLAKKYDDIIAAALEAGKGTLKFGKDVEDSAAKVVTLETKLKSVQNGLRDFGSSMRQVGAGLTAAVTAPIVGVAGAAIKLGMDAVESENLVAVSFGGMLDAANTWSKGLSKSLGLNEFELRKQAGTLYNMFTSMGLAKQGAFDMATGMTKLAADMASFRNISTEEAMTKLRSGIVGMARPLENIGILVDAATVKQYAYKNGIAAYGSELTNVQKVQARWLAILDQTKNDQGDLARTMDSPTNKLRIMSAQIQQAGIQLGMVLLPYAMQFIDLLARGVGHLSSWVEAFGKWPEPLKLVTLGLLAGAAAIGPLMVGFGVLAGGVNNLITLYTTLRGAQLAVAASMQAMAAATLASSGEVAAAEAVAAGTMTGFGVTATGIAGTVVTALQAAGAAIVGFFGWPVIITAAVVAAGAALLSYFGLLGPTVEMLKDIGKILIYIGEVAIGGVITWVKDLVSGWGDMIVSAGQAYYAVEKWVVGLVGIDLDGVIEKFKAFGGSWAETIVDAVDKSLAKIKEWAHSAYDYIKDVADSLSMSMPTVHSPAGFKSVADQAADLQLKMIALPDGAKIAASGFDRLNESLAEAKRELASLDTSVKAKLSQLLKAGYSPTEISKASQSDGGIGISEKVIELFRSEQREAEKAGKAVKKHADDVTAASSSMKDLSGAQIEAIKYYLKEGDSATEIAKKLEIYAHQVNQVIDAEKAAKKSADDMTKARAEMARVTAQLQMSFKSIPSAEHNMAGFMPDIADIKANIAQTEQLQQQHYQWMLAAGRVSFDEQRKAVAAETADKLKNLDKTREGWEMVEGQIIQHSYDMYDDIERKEKETLAKMHAQEFSWSNSFKMFASGIAQNIAQALLNGGNVVKAFAATTSQVLADAGKRAFSFDDFGKAGPLAGLNDKIASGAGKLFGKGFGDAVFTAIPFIGGMIGSLVGPLMEKAIGKIKEVFGGPSAKELEGRKVEGAYEAQLAGTLTATQRLRAGTSQLAQAVMGLQQQYIGLGMSSEAAARLAQDDMKALLDAEKQGAEAVKHVQDVIAARQESMKAVTSGVDELSNAVKAAGGKIPDYLKPAIKSFLEMKNLTDDQRAALQGLLTDAEPDYQKLTEAAAKYGITIGQLGPKFQQASITDRAMQIAHDFQDITAAGGDVQNVINGMGKSVNELVQDAMKYGVSIPEALRPVVENLFNTGQLVDANGKKIDDMSKISFSETPLEKSTKDIVAAIDKLTKLFQNMPGIAMTAASGVANALDQIPDETHKKVIIDSERRGDSGTDNTGVNGGNDNGDQPREADTASRGGLVTSTGVQYLAGGGHIMARMFRPKGTDTVPAMLTPGERVLSVDQNNALTKAGGLMSALSNGSEMAHAMADAVRGLVEALASGSTPGGILAAKLNEIAAKAANVQMTPDLWIPLQRSTDVAEDLLMKQHEIGANAGKVGDDFKQSTDVIRNCWIGVGDDIEQVMKDARKQIDQMPDTIPITFEPKIDLPANLPPWANDWSYNLGDHPEIKHLAMGGPIFAASGTDTIPAMLTPGERVLSVSQNQAFEAGIALAGRGDDDYAAVSEPPQVVNVHAHLMLEGKHVTSVVLNDVIHDKGGAKQKLRRAVSGRKR